MRFLSLAVVCWSALAVTAAPGLSEKIPKWQYAELNFRTVPGRPAGATEDGAEIPAVPASMLIRWLTATGETEVKSWADLAESLKATGLKRDGSPALQKIQMLNFLGAEGWELIEQQGAGTVPVTGAAGRGGPGMSIGSSLTTVWLFKRRLP